jgi:hypothetical protein
LHASSTRSAPEDKVKSVYFFPGCQKNSRTTFRPPTPHFTKYLAPFELQIIGGILVNIVDTQHCGQNVADGLKIYFRTHWTYIFEIEQSSLKLRANGIKRQKAAANSVSGFHQRLLGLAVDEGLNLQLYMNEAELSARAMGGFHCSEKGALLSYLLRVFLNGIHALFQYLKQC